MRADGATHVSPVARLVGAIERWVWTTPLWILTAAVIGASVLIHGYGQTGAMWETVLVVADPFAQDEAVGSWRYQSSLGEILAWALHMRTAEAIAAFNFNLVCALVLGAAYGVKRWHSDYAGRLFLLAFFCSPQAWAAVASLGLFDIITVAGVAVAAVAPAAVCLPVGLVVGFNHFEQAAVATVGLAVIRHVRGESQRPTLAFIVGLAAGKALVTAHLLIHGIETSGRLDFIREKGLVDIIGGWTSHVPVLLWAVFNVLWVGMIWMLWSMGVKERAMLIAAFAVVTIPVLITYDLSRVYRMTTWPFVMMLVLYAAEQDDRGFVRRWALLLCVAAVFVPRTEIWHGGLVIN
jgi:hypothetical protein